MTTKGFAVSHARDAQFIAGLRSFFEYRDLGVRDATEGRVAAHVIRARPGAPFSGAPHRHGVTFQLVYVLKGWIEFEYEGQGVVRLEPGSGTARSGTATTSRCSRSSCRPTTRPSRCLRSEARRRRYFFSDAR